LFARERVEDAVVVDACVPARSCEPSDAEWCEELPLRLFGADLGREGRPRTTGGKLASRRARRTPMA
jgi:hypothetical protein